MGSDRYLPFLPVIMDWIQRTLDAHAPERRVVSSFNFPRLPQYFSAALLKSARVVVTGKLPRPPLSALGLREFSYFENQFISGISKRPAEAVLTNLLHVCDGEAGQAFVAELVADLAEEEPALRLGVKKVPVEVR